MWQFLAIISALFSALAAVFEKKALFKIEPLGFSLIVSLITFVFTVPFLFLVDFGSITIEALCALYLKSTLGAAAFLFVMHGIKKNQLSNSLPLLVLTPGVVAVCAFFLLGERLGLSGIVGMLLLLSGTYFLQLENGNFLSPFRFVQRNKAQWYIIGAIMLFSATSILDKTILKNYKLQAEAFLPIQQLFFCFNYLLIFSFGRGNTQKLKIQFKQTWRLIVAVALFAVVYRYTHILAVKAGSVALVLSIKRTSVFFAAVFGGRYFNENNLLKRALAIIVMLLGALALILL